MGNKEPTKTLEPVTSADLEDVALRVSQSVSTLVMLTNCHEANTAPNLQNALALVTDHLGKIAKDLGELHHRSEQEVRP